MVSDIVNFSITFIKARRSTNEKYVPIINILDYRSEPFNTRWESINYNLLSQGRIYKCLGLDLDVVEPLFPKYSSFLWKPVDDTVEESA